MTTLYGKAALNELDTSYPEWQMLAPDEQIHVSHVENCDNTTDHKERLYIINKGGAYLFHCHNCGLDGYYRPRDVYSPIKDESLGVTRRCAPGVMDYAMVFSTETEIELTTEARLWLAEYEMLDNPFTIFTKRGLMLPIFSEGGFLLGFQVRHFKGEVKYNTYITGAQCGSCMPRIGHDSSPLIIVEDLLSSYKLHMAGHNSYALLGTNATNIPGGYARAILWLDKDLAGEKGSVTLYRELAPLFSGGISVMYNDQPKEVPLETLKVLAL